MYFDAVVSGDLSFVYFNGTKEETVKWLRSRKTSETAVIDGKTLRQFTVKEYLDLEGK